MKHAFKQGGPYAEWPIEAPVSRNFDCEIVAPSVGVDGRLHDFDARLKLRANTKTIGSQRECFLTFVLQSENDEQMTNLERWAPVKELVEQFPELCVWTAADAPHYGTWRRYLLEVEKAHAALEILGWELTAEELAIMDAADDYARQAPARYVTAGLTPTLRQATEAAGSPLERSAGSSVRLHRPPAQFPPGHAVSCWCGQTSMIGATQAVRRREESWQLLRSRYWIARPTRTKRVLRTSRATGTQQTANGLTSWGTPTARALRR